MILPAVRLLRKLTYLIESRAMITFSVKEFGQARRPRCGIMRRGNIRSDLSEEQNTADGMSQLAETLTGKVIMALVLNS